MDSDYYELIYCPEDGEYRVYCEICDKLCIEDNEQINKFNCFH